MHHYIEKVYKKGVNTWNVVFPLPNTQVLLGRWVLDMKFNAMGNWERNRARWVVCSNFENTKS
jgi:hypothetical protein